MNAGSRDDVVEALDEAGTNTINYGEGTDTVDIDGRVDVVAADCENTDPR